MGRMVEELAAKEQIEIAGIIDSEKDWLKLDIRNENGCNEVTAIDFSTPSSVLDNIEQAWKRNIPIVVGTTGWYDRMDEIKKEFRRKLTSLVLPITFQQFILAVVSASDALMVGVIGQDLLSAVSLAGQITFVYNLFLAAMIIGTSMFAAQYWGKGHVRTWRDHRHSRTSCKSRASGIYVYRSGEDRKELLDRR